MNGEEGRRIKITLHIQSEDDKRTEVQEYKLDHNFLLANSNTVLATMFYIWPVLEMNICKCFKID